MFPSYPPSFADCISVCWRADICVSSPNSSVAAIAPISAEWEHTGTRFTFCSFPGLQRFDILKLRDIFSFSFFFFCKSHVLPQCVSFSSEARVAVASLSQLSELPAGLPSEKESRYRYQTERWGKREWVRIMCTRPQRKKWKTANVYIWRRFEKQQCFMSMTCTAVESNCKWIYSKSWVVFFLLCNLNLK